MKRCIALLSVLAVLLSLAACGSETPATIPATEPALQVTEAVLTEKAPVSQYWELLYTESDDPDWVVTTQMVTEAKGQGVPMYLEFLTDGTGTFCFEDTTDILWTDGIMVVEGEDPFTFAIDDNRLVLDLRELTMVYRRAEKPGSRTSDMEEAGITDFVEKWEIRPYTTICSEDESKTTTGEAAVIAYEIFTSDVGYPEKEGYEWRVVTFEVRFFDENAQNYGAYPFYRFEDYYCVQLHDETCTEEDMGDYTCYTMTRLFCGEEVQTQLRVRDSWSNWRKDSDGNDEVFYNIEFAFHVPEGYDGAVAGLEDGSYLYPDDYDVTDCQPEYFLLFRLN